MTGATESTGFGAVGRSRQVEHFVRYLDEARRQRSIVQAKEWTIGKLDLHLGDRALDVGCGTGEEVVTMAAVAGPVGAAIGVDSSGGMITEALRRHGQQADAFFGVADAQRLPFNSAVVDACRIERTLQHLVDPDQAVAEIARILKVGGRAALVEPDWETMVIEGSDPELSTLIWTKHITRNRQPRIGRRLGGMLASHGFEEVDVDATVASVTRLMYANAAFRLEDAAHHAVATGVIVDAVAARWLADLEEADHEERFFCAVTNFCVAGKKGEHPERPQR